MPKMRIGWYAGVSTALAGGVVLSAFHQRANFYSAMVYLAQSNFCLLALVNFTLLVYSSFIYGLTRLCFGSLRAIEVEQLTERAWFAITETCLAMTIFRDEIGAWFLVMFTALVTGKVWGWIGDGRVEFLEQQPPANPRLFHTRLSISLALSFIYDILILRYTINTVIQQAKPNMMVMFLFEFAVLATCSWRTGARYLLSLAEQHIVQTQTRKRLLERRQEVRQQREEMIRERERAAAAGEDPPENQEPLPNEEDVEEMDIEVPGWAAKGEWVLWLDLATDMIKLGIYVAFFFMLLMFYGLPIHIMRDLFMTARDFVKRLNALLRYRRAMHEMNKHPDATAEDLAQENTCIICREEMHIWDPASNPGTLDRVRPKKLPCGHILHLGCLKSWLERQQVCPTCRTPVTGDRARTAQNRAVGLRIQIGGGAAPHLPGQQPPPNNNMNNGALGQPRQDGAAPQGQVGGARVFNLGPLRFGFGGNQQQVQHLAQQFGMPQVAGHQGPAPTPTPTIPTTLPQTTGDNMQHISSLLHQTEQLVQREMHNLQATQSELMTLHLLTAELQRLRQRRQQGQGGPAPGLSPNLPFGFGANTAAAPSGLSPLHPGVPIAASQPHVGSPLMTRHGAPGAAIPSGSSELPEGVVIPPGWSLMPLQRLDGAQQTGQASSHPATEPQGLSDTVNGPSNSSTTHTTFHNMTGGEGAASDTPTPTTAADGGSTATETHTSERTRANEPTPTAASSSAMPNWSGSAQLFSAPTRTINDSSDGQGPSGTLANGGSSSSDKGKGKAVTVEEAEEEE